MRKWVDFYAEQSGEELIVFDDLDDAIVGITTVHTLPPRVVYSWEKIIEILMAQGMSDEEAQEYFDFNIGCLYAGPGTPAILYTPGDDWE